MSDTNEPMKASDELALFKAAHSQLDLLMTKDAWGRSAFYHPHVQSLWDGWRARAALVPAPLPGVTMGVEGRGMPEVRWCYDDHGQVFEYCDPEEVRAALSLAGGGWIECSERMPDLGERVLAFGVSEDRYRDARYSVAYRTEREDEGDVDGWIDLHHDSLPPTHWRPLPPPPATPSTSEGEEQ